MSKQNPKPELPPKRRHRSKFQLESIHVDELLSAAGMSGYLGVLDPPVSAPAHLEKLASEMMAEIEITTELPERYQASWKREKELLEKGTPQKGIPVLSVPERGTPSSVDLIPAVDIEPIEKGVPVSGVPDSIRLPKRRVIRQATLVQDGHSLGEQLVYQTLWDHAQPFSSPSVQTPPDTRVISIGYRTLSELCGLTVNNCKANLLALIQKLAIQEFSGHSATHAKSYLVYSYTGILRRRKTAGLTHVVRTRGVVFVDPVSGEEIQKGVPVSGIPDLEKGTPPSGRSGIPVSGTTSLDIQVRQAPAPSTSPSPDHLLVQKALAHVGASADDDAVRQLLTACQRHAPDATGTEVVAMVQWKAAQLDPMRIRNRMGYLLAAVPKCFEGTLLTEYRRQQEVESRTEARESLDDTLAEMRQILENPASSEEDRAFARRILNAER